MGRVDVEPAVVVVVPRSKPHARLRHPVAVDGASEERCRLAEHDPPSRLRPLVDKQKVGGGVIGDIDIGATVVGEVGHRHAERLVARAEQPPRLGHRPEEPVAKIFVALVGPVLDVAGMADPRLSFDVAAVHRLEGVVADIIANIEIEIAIEVEIGPGGRRAPAFVANPGRSGDIDERPVAEVAVQGVGPDVRHIDIVEAVVVEVSDGHPLSVAGLADPGGEGDIDKPAPAPRGRGDATEEAVEGLVGPIDGRRIPPLIEIQIPQTVAVEVEPADPAADRLDHQRATRLTVAVDMLEAAGRADILETRAGDRVV